MCDAVTYVVEDPDPNGPFGANECGQGPLLPVPPAVANAVYDAVGVRIDEVPITPEKVFKALRRKAKGEEPRYGPDRFPRSEEHTSELQSRLHLVCRLLLEKKKKQSQENRLSVDS